MTDNDDDQPPDKSKAARHAKNAAREWDDAIDHLDNPAQRRHAREQQKEAEKTAETWRDQAESESED